MKKFITSWSLFFFLAPCIFIACTNGAGDAGGYGLQQTAADHKAPPKMGNRDNSISFAVNGEPVETGLWVISRYVMDDVAGVNIVGNMKEDKRNLQFNVNGWTPGRYPLLMSRHQSMMAYGNYRPDYENILSAYSFCNGEIEILSLDTTKGLVNAIFHGDVVSTERDTLHITNGKIVNGKLNNGVIRY